MEKLKRAFRLRALVCAALAGPLAACARAAPETEADAPPLVEIAVAAPAHAAGTLRASGLVAYKRETELSFQAPGVIAALSVDAGDSVRRGQRLGALRRTNVGTNVTEAALARETAERQLARTQILFDRGFVSQAALEDARLAVERARDSAALAAPASGVILRRLAEPAQTVNAGEPVLILGETESGFIVRAPFAAQKAARIRLGDSAVAHIGEAAPRAGAVARIAAKSDSATGAFEIEVRLMDVEGLRSGEVAEVEIQTDGSRQSAVGNRESPAADCRPPTADCRPLIVPALSLLDARADQGVVFVVDAQSVARRRPVQIGGLDGDSVLVLAGLTPGERVVASGAAFVRDGVRVRIAQRRQAFDKAPGR